MKTVNVQLHEQPDGEPCWTQSLRAAVNCEADHDRAIKFLGETLEMALHQMQGLVQTTVDFMKNKGASDEKLFIELAAVLAHPQDGDGADDMHVAASTLAAVVIASARKLVEEGH